LRGDRIFSADPDQHGGRCAGERQDPAKQLSDVQKGKGEGPAEQPSGVKEGKAEDAEQRVEVKDRYDILGGVAEPQSRRRRRTAATRRRRCTRPMRSGTAR
jgi:hypothetical protein